jgi:tRNA G10  N-methylase Trm11
MIHKNKHFIAILGRQPDLSLAELSALYGTENVKPLAQNLATVEAPEIDLSRLGGTLKIAEIIEKSPLDYLLSLKTSGKLTLGFSDYSPSATKKSTTITALKLKNILKRHGRSVRIVPNLEPALSTATSHHNQLGEKPNHIEFILYKNLVAVSHGTQNITQYKNRDQVRPARDAKIGMLPPKLAQILINLSVGQLHFQKTISPEDEHTNRSLTETIPQKTVSPEGEHTGRSLPEATLQKTALPECDIIKAPLTEATPQKTVLPEGDAIKASLPEARQSSITILDPFCGTGTVLQEALLMGYRAYGTDLNPTMVAYSEKNLDWLTSKSTFSKHFISPFKKPDYRVESADATSHKWTPPIDCVATETYLGPPMSAPPVDIKLKTVKQEVSALLLAFLRNLAPQIAKNTPLALAVPAWLRPDGTYSTLKILDEIEKLGYTTEKSNLLYYRENQIVAREIIILRKN